MIYLVFLFMIAVDCYVIFNGDPMSPAEVMAGIGMGIAIAGIIRQVSDDLDA